MNKKFTFILICFLVLVISLPKTTHAIDTGGIGSDGVDINDYNDNLSCTGKWVKIICIVKKTADYIKTIQKVTRALDYLPVKFPFGGPILSSERACSFKFDLTTWWGISIFGVPVPVPIGPAPASLPLSWRAIEVGPPVPTNGKVIGFPWISKIYDHHTENRSGPWALGLGFSPFPLPEINDALGDVVIWIPPVPADPPDCLIPDPSFIGRVGFLAECIDNLRFDCQASGEKDLSGNDIYKVILKLGTSQEDVSADALQQLKTNFPSFSWPLP